MNHLNTNVCECGHAMTAHDKTGPMQRNHQRGLYGGNVTAFADGKCPECGTEYQMWLRQAKNSWEVVTLATIEPQAEKAAAAPVGDEDEFDLMERDELKDYLDGLGVEYTANWGEKRLRELARSSAAALNGGNPEGGDPEGSNQNGGQPEDNKEDVE